MEKVKMAASMKFCTHLSITITLFYALCLRIEAKPAQALSRQTAVNNIPPAQTQMEMKADNDVYESDIEEPSNNDPEEADNENENDIEVESVVAGDADADLDVVEVDAGPPNPIGRNGWTGSGLWKSKKRNEHSSLATESKVSHIGIGFGVVILVIAVVVVSGLAIKRPGSSNTSNIPPELNID
nr:uncharacterized protein LOC129260588 [Lytechinus pictus]